MTTIDQVLGDAARRVSQADGVSKEDRTTTLEVVDAGPVSLATRVESGLQIRVFHEGRVGVVGRAGGVGEGGGEQALIEEALAAAVTGPRCEFALPAPAPMPSIQTEDPAVRTAGPGELLRLAAAVRRRLEGAGRQIAVGIQASAGSTRVLNTRGTVGQYDGTLLGIAATVRSRGGAAQPHAPPCTVTWAAARWPTEDELDDLAAEVQARLSPPLLDRPAPFPTEVMVCFAPRAAHVLLRPLRAGLQARALFTGPEDPSRSPLADALLTGEPAMHTGLTIVDDPGLAGRPGSRPIDDEGVITRRAGLVEAGHIRGWSADLTTGAALGVPATGHGWRGRHAETRAVFHNMRIVPPADAPGDADLVERIGDGLLVRDLVSQGGGARGGGGAGGLVLRAPWAYRVIRGEIVGRIEGVVLTGNLYRMLLGVAGIGNSPQWVGAAELPMLLIERVGVHLER